MRPALHTRLFRNLPNLLTVLRLVLVPVVGRAILVSEFRQAALLIFIAGATDALDGFLARRFHWSSDLGAYLDPLADKALLVTSYVALGLAGAIPVWLVWLVLGRDLVILLMVALAFLLTGIRKFPPTIWGKLSTVGQVTAALVIIAGRAWSEAPHSAIESVCIYGAALLTLGSGLHYLWIGWGQFWQARRPGATV